MANAVRERVKKDGSKNETPSTAVLYNKPEQPRQANQQPESYMQYTYSAVVAKLLPGFGPNDLEKLLLHTDTFLNPPGGNIGSTILVMVPHGARRVTAETSLCP